MPWRHGSRRFPVSRRSSPRVVTEVVLDVPGLSEPATGRLVSVRDRPAGMLNALHLRRGRMVEAGSQDEVVASEAFAEANQLIVGDQLGAIVNGRWRLLRIVGIGLSPEYIYQIGAGNIYPGRSPFRRALDEPERPGPGARPRWRLQRRGAHAVPGRFRAGRDRPARSAARPLWRARRLRPLGAALAPLRDRRDRPEQGERRDAGLRLPRRRRVPAQPGPLPTGRDAAGANRRAQGVRLFQRRHRGPLPPARHAARAGGRRPRHRGGPLPRGPGDRDLPAVLPVPGPPAPDSRRTCC